MTLKKELDGYEHAQRFGSWLAFDLLKLKAGETLAVSGGAGLLAYLHDRAREAGRAEGDRRRESFGDGARAGQGADVVVARGKGFCAEVRAATNGGADALFDTALLGRDAFPAIRDGGAYVPVRGWDKTPAERGIRVLPVFVSEVLERTEWLNELRDLVSRGRIKLRVAGEYPPERAARSRRRRR